MRLESPNFIHSEGFLSVYDKKCDFSLIFVTKALNLTSIHVFLSKNETFFRPAISNGKF